MIFYICMLLLGIALGLYAIANYGFWLLAQTLVEKVDYFKMPIPIIERTYRAVDYRSEKTYVPIDVAIRMPMASFQNVTQNHMEVIENDRHKQHVIHSMTHELAKQMVKDGIAEIKDDRHPYNPYHRVLQVNVKVYQRER